jgi:hypothetical protein
MKGSRDQDLRDQDLRDQDLRDQDLRDQDLNDEDLRDRGSRPETDLRRQRHEPLRSPAAGAVPLGATHFGDRRLPQEHNRINRLPFPANLNCMPDVAFSSRKVNHGLFFSIGNNVSPCV